MAISPEKQTLLSKIGQYSNNPEISGRWVKDLLALVSDPAPAGIANGYRDLTVYSDGGQSNKSIPFPFTSNVVVNKIIVTTITDNNNAFSVTGANSTGNSANGVVSPPTGQVPFTIFSTTPTSNNTVAAGSSYYLNLSGVLPQSFCVSIQYSEV